MNASGYRRDTGEYVESRGSARVTVMGIIRILSPKNSTYTIDSVPLTFTVIEPISWIGYSLDGQANVTITGNTTLTGLSDGPHLLIVHANDTYGRMESDEVHFIVETRTHNIAVTNVTTSQTVVGRGYSITINVTVENQGNSTETFNVTAYANFTSFDRKEEITLTNGNFTIVKFVWNTTGFATYENYTISAYAHPVLGETPEDNLFINGIITVVHPGDVNCDGKVDIIDISKIAVAFGSKTGELRYNPNYDINCDGVISILDVAKVAINFGYVGGFRAA